MTVFALIMVMAPDGGDALNYTHWVMVMVGVASLGQGPFQGLRQLQMLRADQFPVIAVKYKAVVPRPTAAAATAMLAGTVSAVESARLLVGLMMAANWPSN